VTLLLLLLVTNSILTKQTDKHYIHVFLSYLLLLYFASYKKGVAFAGNGVEVYVSVKEEG
jgi:uncharacterized membrane protein